MVKVYPACIGLVETVPAFGKAIYRHPLEIKLKLKICTKEN
jgi:hypothetical protein